jgi:hypothetical protein
VSNFTQVGISVNSIQFFFYLTRRKIYDSVFRMYNKNIKPSASTKDSRVLRVFPTGCKIRFHDFLNFHRQAKIYLKSNLRKSSIT